MPRIVLHQWEMSPFCNMVRRCLRHKRLTFEVRNYNGLLALRASRLSPAGTLPVLDHGEQRIGDSHQIAKFLDAQYPQQPLFPSEPQAAAAAWLWEDWAAQSLYFYEIRFRMLDPAARERALDLICEGRPRFERAILGWHFRRHYPVKLREQGIASYPDAELETRFFRHLDGLEVLLDGRRSLTGFDITAADYAVAAQLDEMIRTSRYAQQIRAYPQVMAWMRRSGGLHSDG